MRLVASRDTPPTCVLLLDRSNTSSSDNETRDGLGLHRRNRQTASKFVGPSPGWPIGVENCSPPAGSIAVFVLDSAATEGEVVVQPIAAAGYHRILEISSAVADYSLGTVAPGVAVSF